MCIAPVHSSSEPRGTESSGVQVFIPSGSEGVNKNHTGEAESQHPPSPCPGDRAHPAPAQPSRQPGGDSLCQTGQEDFSLQ